MERINVEITHRDRARIVQVRAVLAVFGGQHLVQVPAVRVPLGETVRALGEQEAWEIRTAVEQEVLGWAAKLPLGYDH